MSDEYAVIKAELELTKKELQSRLEMQVQIEMGDEIFYTTPSFLEDKQKMIVNHIKEDLYDVERALNKIEYGIYGICEETGQFIPLEKMKILPTARTINDFSINDYYEKKSLPHENIPQFI